MAELEENDIRVNINIEDKANYGFYFTWKLKPSISFKQLKHKVWLDWRLPADVQRWMVGRRVVQDNDTLESCHVHDQDSVFLYIVSPRRYYMTRQRFLQQTSPRLPPPKPVVLKQKVELPKPEILAPAFVEEKTKVGWDCPACTFRNKPLRPGCEQCGTERPATYQVPEDYEPTRAERSILEQEEDAARLFQESKMESAAAAKKMAASNFGFLQEAYSSNITFTNQQIHCSICMEDYPAGEGVILQNCLHAFCKECIIGHIQHNEEGVVKCPFQEDYTCNVEISQHEIKSIVSGEIFQKHLRRGLQIAESQDPNSYHCKTPDCEGWCTYEDEVNFFKCPLCKRANCLTCKAIHVDMDCREYQDDLKRRARNDLQARRTQEAVQRMLDEGTAMRCPGCGIILQKKQGCDWLQCSMCKMEICWVTKGPRWGPRGKGDTSGGCKCGIGGRSCHPSCGFCH